MSELMKAVPRFLKRPSVGATVVEIILPKPIPPRRISGQSWWFLNAPSLRPVACQEMLGAGRDSSVARHESTAVFLVPDYSAGDAAARID
jgi:hypothetical protein